MTLRRTRTLAGTPALLCMLGLTALIASCTHDDGVGDRSTFTPLLRFDREKVTLHVQTGRVEVEGIYEFLCTGGVADSSLLFYPYPRDSLLGPASTRLVEGRCGDGPAQPIRFTEHPPGGVSWSIPLNLCERITIRTVYRQELLGNYARYIVTSTAAWKRPLTHARFEIELPEDAIPEEFSFPFVRDDSPGANVWIYETMDFMPKEDITVRWQQPVEAGP